MDYLPSVAKEFQFTYGESPLSTIPEVTVSVIIYLVIVFALEFFMKNKKPVNGLRWILVFHNGFLSLISGILLVLLLVQILPELFREGLFHTICSEEFYRPTLAFLYFLNYLTKYYELVDTIFIILRKGKLTFLHVYHHSLTLVLCYTQLIGTTTVQWIPITLNLMVHLVMYYYYALTGAGIRDIWWKKYLTTLQITQFVLDVIFVYYCTIGRITGLFFLFATIFMGPLLNKSSITNIYSLFFCFKKDTVNCHGSTKSAVFGCFLLSSYLLLFIKFFYETYRPKRIKRS